MQRPPERDVNGTGSHDPFSAPDAVASYADRPRRTVPGFDAMQSLAGLLLAERAPDEARLLVLGAGGGLEMRAWAEARPGWRFDGVDPSGPMLALAERTLGALASRVRLHEGTIEVAPEGPFDGASCLLTFHFIAPEARVPAIAEVRRRLRPGAPFVVAHLSLPRDADERALWLSRHAAFLATQGMSPSEAARASATIAERTHILSPEEDEAALREAGFSKVSPFWTAFAFRGWVASA